MNGASDRQTALPYCACSKCGPTGPVCIPVLRALARLRVQHYRARVVLVQVQEETQVFEALEGVSGRSRPSGV